MTIETIGIDREPLEFFAYASDVCETGGLILLCLPVAGEVAGTATNAQTFYITSTTGQTAAIKSQIHQYRTGEFADRDYCFHATVESKFLYMGNVQHPPIDSFPYFISQQNRDFHFRATRAKIQLVYRDLDFDPVYISQRSKDKSFCRAFAGTRFGDDKFILPEILLNTRFERNEFVTASAGDDRRDPKVVIHLLEIDDRGLAEVTLYSWQDDFELQANVTLWRSKRWFQMSTLDGQLYERIVEAEFAVVREILSTKDRWP
jgi:hypothetical protein